MAGSWEPEIEALVVEDPSVLPIDQWISFCSVLDARQTGCGRRTTPWYFYELSTLPEDIVEHVNCHDHAYLTSSFVQKVFIDHGVTTPTSVLGHGIDPRLYQYSARARSEPFTFLSVGEHTPRKNLPALIRCFERAFSSTENVRLVLKLGLHGEGDLRRHIIEPSRIVLLTESLDREEELVELYRQAHCFVLPTRAEGFGMPVLEAMATGLPVIVTGHGGHLDFCTDDNSYLIKNCGLVASDPGCFPYVESLWGDPDEEHLTHLLRLVYEDYDRASELGVRAAEMVAKEWTWEQQLSRAFP